MGYAPQLGVLDGLPFSWLDFALGAAGPCKFWRDLLLFKRGACSGPSSLVGQNQINYAGFTGGQVRSGGETSGKSREE